MAEKEFAVSELRLSYEGLFELEELYNHMDQWFKRHGYDKRETKDIETVTEDGKHIEIEWLPDKPINGYAYKAIKIRMIASEIKEVEIEKDGKKLKMDKGKVDFVFWGALTTDWENKWENKPVLFFIRSIYNKFLYKGYNAMWKGALKADVMNLNQSIKAFLNISRYR